MLQVLSRPEPGPARVAGMSESTRVAGMLEAVREAAARDLRPVVAKVDAEGFYPEAALRAFGAAGAYRSHLPEGDRADLWGAIQASAAAGEHCLSTAFCMWCQDALAWYLGCSDNAGLRNGLGREVAAGTVLGGTGLSNPMKTFFGIEQIRLKGERVAGGYRVTGALPWVSNLGDGHCFAIVFARPEGRYAMAIVRAGQEGVSLVDGGRFLALDGSGTYGVQLRNVFVPDEDLLADPIDGYLKRIRAGFVLMQTGMGIGVVRACIALMREVERPLGHVNRYLDVQPDDVAGQLAALEAEVAALSATPFDPDPAYWRRVVTARLAASELAVAAAHHAMLHCGARGYVQTGAAQRRLREAYFVAIVTPAVKQLKKMLADMDA
ncbi:acyl-CoA dehydrogenase family protein [Methylobacterium nonmethylotrophicum]|uniref:Acyl-CoA dehydrogenase n=1 Tax=Methylobacterium nonmethylotrophicum TaxID=1141884 RepID=A0A4Z0NVH0_9HYPH|nr:acyl-CoA dehydrogenase family protein [Methylobacterium nonmethylotrophicum]TGE01723.1 acyl-CoA dehydrogenase [Methylobacterium nonmethylotrophicum]